MINIPKHLIEPMNEREVEYLRLLREALRAASTDGLTGLLNKQAWESKVEYGCFIFIDVDGLKRVNDKYQDHDAGTTLIQGTAHAIKRSVRPQDWACRVGGDEFCINLPNATLAEAKAIALRIMMAIRGTDLSRLYEGSCNTSRELLQSEVLTVSIGVGMTEYQADVAMYKAKQHGGDTFRIFQETITVGG